MLTFFRRNGQTSNVFRVRIDYESTWNAAVTGLTSASSGLIISTIADNEATATTYTEAGGTIEGITTLGTFAAPTATKIRFKEVDATNHKGLYEIQPADARMAVSGARYLDISISGAAGIGTATIRVQLEPVPANLTQIDQNVTNGNNATLNLKQLNIVNNAGDAIVASSTGSNGNGINATGNGTGNGVKATSGAGATGDGVACISVSTNGNGFSTTGTGTGSGLAALGGATGNGISGTGGATSGFGIQGAAQNGNGSGIYGSGQGAGSGMRLAGGVTGYGMRLVGGATSGHAMYGTATDGDGVRFVGGTNGSGAVLVGAGSGEGLSSTGGATGNGAEFVAGATSGHGVLASATNGSGGVFTGGTNGNGIGVSGAGSGDGLSIAADTTGNGVQIIGGSSSGHGTYSRARGTGDGVSARGGSTSGAGLKAEGVAGNSPGFSIIGQGTARGIEATGEPQLTGSITTATGLTTTTFRDSTKSATNDFYNDCAVAFISGTLAGLAFHISDYDGTNKEFTVSAMPATPSNGDRFIIIGRVRG